MQDNNSLFQQQFSSIWIVTREYAHIAEAGGVKNVSCSLAENLCKLGIDVTVFIPEYKCTDYTLVKDIKKSEKIKADILVDNKNYEIFFTEGILHGVKIVFIRNKIFGEKNDIYVYTRNDELHDSRHKKGIGHFDCFEMNSIFQQAVLHYGFLKKIQPQIIHSHDAASCMTSVYARNLSIFCEHYKNTKFAVTIHNAGPGYLHSFCGMDFAKRITGLSEEVLKYGIASYDSNMIEPFLLSSKDSFFTTVSPWYAEELFDADSKYNVLAKDFCRLKINIKGITNGIDYEKYDPKDIKKSKLDFAFDPANADFDGKYKQRDDFLVNMKKMVANYPDLEFFGGLEAVDKDTVVFVYQGRMVSQKGIEIFAQAAQNLLLQKKNVCFIVHGQGQNYIENSQIEIAKKFSDRYVYIRGYERKIARTCVAVGDFLVLPSLFEPCGLEDFISQIYGTLPVAHAVGGLKKIKDFETGFLYKENDSKELQSLLERLIILKNENPVLLQQMIIKAASSVKKEYSWYGIIKKEYMTFYKKILFST
ncbi:MAG: glycogen/starch synthase [Treponemataceae bacterium]